VSIASPATGGSPRGFRLASFAREHRRLWYPLRKRLRPLPTWVFLLLLLPFGGGGTAHWISNFLSGIGQDFRYTNAWLATLTNGAFPDTFYTGNLYRQRFGLVQFLDAPVERRAFQRWAGGVDASPFRRAAGRFPPACRLCCES